MKLLNWVALIAMNMAIMFIASVNLTWAADSIRQPTSVVQTVYEYDSYLNKVPSQVRQDTLVADDTKKSLETPATEQPSPNTTQDTQESVDYSYVAPCEPPKPWHLPQPCVFQQMGISMGGWVEQGITFNSDRPADKFNGPNLTNDRDREYQIEPSVVVLQSADKDRRLRLGHRRPNRRGLRHRLALWAMLWSGKSLRRPEQLLRPGSAAVLCRGGRQQSDRQDGTLRHFHQLTKSCPRR